jgi:hypothetical protein
MIYIFKSFGHTSIVYDESTLRPEDKKGGIAVSSLPPSNPPEGYYPIIDLDANNKPFWRYEPMPKDTLEDLVRKQIITKEQYKTLTGKDYIL